MKKLRTMIITAAIAFPLGALAGDAVLKGHPNLQKSRHALGQSQEWIAKSQEANEKV